MPACESKLVCRSSRKAQWQRLYSMGRPRTCDRMPSLVVDRGPMLRVLGWALTRMRDTLLLLQCSREER